MVGNMELNKISHNDAEYGLMDFPRDCCDICICSPPYKNSDNFQISKMEGVFREVFRVLKDDTLFFLNFGHLKEDKFRPFRVCQVAMDCGFKLNDTIVWRKNHFTPLNGKKNLNNLSEFIFMLYKGERSSATVACAAKKLNKQFIGFEINQSHWEVGNERLLDFQETKDIKDS